MAHNTFDCSYVLAGDAFMTQNVNECAQRLYKCVLLLEYITLVLSLHPTLHYQNKMSPNE